MRGFLAATVVTKPSVARFSCVTGNLCLNSGLLLIATNLYQVPGIHGTTRGYFSNIYDATMRWHMVDHDAMSCRRRRRDSASFTRRWRTRETRGAVWQRCTPLRIQTEGIVYREGIDRHFRPRLVQRVFLYIGQLQCLPCASWFFVLVIIRVLLKKLPWMRVQRPTRYQVFNTIDWYDPAFHIRSQ